MSTEHPFEFRTGPPNQGSKLDCRPNDSRIEPTDLTPQVFATARLRATARYYNRSFLTLSI